MADERVALYDEHGSVVGAVARSVMRRDNLWHAASSILVHDGRGAVYLHRRTATKDVYPALLDFAAGGVVLDGEDPALGAVREVAEELGVRGAVLSAGGVVPYADPQTRYHAHRFTVEWTGPLVWQPEEVEWGAWVPLTELVARVADEPGSFVPDSVAVWRDILSRWLESGAPAPSAGGGSSR